ncbi:prolipoprotein diacylglyceryl transferase [Nocardioides sp. Y6]|uniref:Phosphatidylglycerol--prolipoprotein diacylglyceryl transferase n=1 Tax=Nocardioides malaquae TaxID=2773426 RepID=A0ABR9RNP7_9ACTN|nr:prolipoprotein diacylglyceryl transferase [Nocardioides malaquae]MBE7323194.1 prolipoprotein diacylglyceryl transferase [Nocardioides malaquae]
MLLDVLLPLTIPSPDQGVWQLGPFPLRAYALCIIAGVVVAVWMGERRWVARGGTPGDVQDLALWAVPFGLVGGRLYHVVTDHHLYFGEGQDPITALYVWRGGLGIWGAVALGALGVVIGARLKGITVLPFLDALAPGVLLAQGIGRWGNWFNQELYGAPTDLPWGLEIDDDHRPYEFVGADVAFHPTFLYESLWAVAGCLLLLWIDRRHRLHPGQVVALYVMVYTAGRGWIENLRIDTVQYDDLLGLRLNSWTSLVLFAVALVAFVVLGRRGSGRPSALQGDAGTPLESAAPQGVDDPRSDG